MAEWVRVCGTAEAPAEGTVAEADANGVTICLARVGGEFAAVDNLCPHRLGPLSEGWIEGQAVVCPWHCWAFDLRTGIAQPPERASVRVFPVRVEGNDVFVNIS